MDLRRTLSKCPLGVTQATRFLNLLILGLGRFKISGDEREKFNDVVLEGQVRHVLAGWRARLCKHHPLLDDGIYVCADEICEPKRPRVGLGNYWLRQLAHSFKAALPREARRVFHRGAQ